MSYYDNYKMQGFFTFNGLRNNYNILFGINYQRPIDIERAHEIHKSLYQDYLAGKELYINCSTLIFKFLPVGIELIDGQHRWKVLEQISKLPPNYTNFKNFVLGKQFPVVFVGNTCDDTSHIYKRLNGYTVAPSYHYTAPDHIQEVSRCVVQHLKERYPGIFSNTSGCFAPHVYYNDLIEHIAYMIHKHKIPIDNNNYNSYKRFIIESFYYVNNYYINNQYEFM